MIPDVSWWMPPLGVNRIVALAGWLLPISAMAALTLLQGVMGAYYGDQQVGSAVDVRDRPGQSSVLHRRITRRILSCAAVPKRAPTARLEPGHITPRGEQ